MSEAPKMKIVCEYPAGTLRTATGVNNLTMLGQGVRVMPGIGKPFLVFADLPAPAVMADFDHESIMVDDGNGNMVRKYVVSADVAANVAMINDMLANPPLDAITLP